MGYPTNQDLINRQKTFWDQDFAQAGDHIPDTLEEVLITDLILDPQLIKSYQSDLEVQTRIKEYATLIKNGTPFPPVLIDGTNNLLDGYHRTLACQLLNFTKIPCLRLVQSRK